MPLSLRAVQGAPWPQAAQRIGQTVTGPVTKVMPFGVFVRIDDREDGFQGLVHTSELDESLGDVVEVGDVLTVKISKSICPDAASPCRRGRPTSDDVDALLWDEEDTWFYFEVDAEGWVTRQVELQGSVLAPIAAASLDEWQHAQQAGALAEYERKFGVTAELPVPQWEGHEPDQLTSQEFEEVWDAAQREIKAR